MCLIKKHLEVGGHNLRVFQDLFGPRTSRTVILVSSIHYSVTSLFGNGSSERAKDSSSLTDSNTSSGIASFSVSHGAESSSVLKIAITLLEAAKLLFLLTFSSIVVIPKLIYPLVERIASIHSTLKLRKIRRLSSCASSSSHYLGVDYSFK